jgi:hypothetical protein
VIRLKIRDQRITGAITFSIIDDLFPFPKNIPVRRNENTVNIPKCARNPIRLISRKSGLGRALPGVQVRIKEIIIQPRKSLTYNLKAYSAINF